MQRSLSLIISGTICLWLLAGCDKPDGDSAGAAGGTNTPAQEVMQSNTVPIPLPDMMVSNVPSATNVLPVKIVVTNLPSAGTNGLGSLTNFFITQTNYGSPFIPIPTPPKKPWWRRIWDWL